MVEWGHTGFTLMSAHLCKFYGTFWKKPKIFSIPLKTILYHFGLSFLTPLYFSVPTINFGHLVAKNFSENGISGIFKKTVCSIISYLTSTLMRWVYWPLFVFMLQPLISALLWSNTYWKWSFWFFINKKIISIQFVPAIYSYRMSLLTPIQLPVPMVSVYRHLCWILLDSAGSDLGLGRALGQLDSKWYNLYPSWLFGCIG